jgi:hypothetical protein
MFAAAHDPDLRIRECLLENQMFSETPLKNPLGNEPHYQGGFAQIL